MSIASFKSFTDSAEANIALTKLQAHDIPCFLTNEHMNDMMQHMKIGLGGIRLMVYEKDFEEAEKILSPDPLEITNEESESVKCPHCLSHNVRYGVTRRSRSGILGFFKLLFGLILLSEDPISNKAYHCFNCEKDFELSNRVV